MSKIVLKCILYISCALVFCVFLHGACYAQMMPKKRILILNSYHKGLSWTDNIVAGIESVFRSEPEGKGVDLYFEYMDTKRYYGERYFKALYDTYREKYRNEHFDAVIVADNDAFNFVRKHYRQLFPSTPIVFCGINNYKDSMIAGHDNFTGVVEDTDVKSTIEIALKLHPHASQFVVVSDRTTTGIAMQHEVLEVIPYFSNRIRFVFLEDFDIGELQAKLRRLPSDSIILLTVVNRDRTGNFFAYEESLDLIYHATKVPIYSFWDFYLGRGIVGGMLTSGFQQGKSAADIAFRILKGENAATIPVVKKSPNLYMFDYRELERFGIKQVRLPKGSIIINEPDTFYSRYKNVIFATSAIIFVLSIIIFTLLVNISLRNRYEIALKKSEEKYRDLYDHAPDMYHSLNRDGIIIDCNETEARMLGYKKEEVIGRPIAAFLTEESRKRYEKEFSTLTEHRELFGLERELVRKDGSTFTASLNVFVEVDEKGSLLRTKTIGRDMTERKRVEIELRRSRQELRNLSAHIQSAREEERGHIAREIHDELGQTLSKLKLDIAWLKKRLSNEQRLLVGKADKMTELVDNTIRTVQRISSELRPGVLDYLGLSAAIEWQAKEFRERTGIPCSTEIAPDVDVEDQHIAIAMFRIFQETLTNIMRHAKASRVDVVLKQETGVLLLEVRDNGQGIPEEKIFQHTSFGLMGIRERARFFNGRVRITGTPGKGTTVAVRIPIENKVAL
jgi:PAS domain S-box-containing protein